MVLILSQKLVLLEGQARITGDFVGEQTGFLYPVKKYLIAFSVDEAFSIPRLRSSRKRHYCKCFATPVDPAESVQIKSDDDFSCNVKFWVWLQLVPHPKLMNVSWIFV